MLISILYADLLFKEKTVFRDRQIIDAPFAKSEKVDIQNSDKYYY